MEYFDSDELSDRVNHLLLSHHVPGITLAVIDDDKISARSFGHASIDMDAPCTPATLFDIASSSKSLTAAAVAILVADEGHPHIQWDTPVAKLLPDDFVLSDARYTDEITVEDLLSHRSGLPNHDDSYMSPTATRPSTPKSVTRNLRNLAMAAPPRTRYIYCNMMYTVASYLVESISGLSFSDFLGQKIFQPLRMNSTSLQPSQAIEKGCSNRMATGHVWDAKAQRYRNFPAWDSPECQGAGSIVTTAEDYILWVKALLNREGPINSAIYEGLVKMRMVIEPDPHASSVAPMCSPTVCASGLEVYWYRGNMVVAHDGSIAGFGSTHFFLPERKFGGVVLGNASSAWDLAAMLSRELIDEALRVPRSERPQWSDHQASLAEGPHDGEGDINQVLEKLGLGQGKSEEHSLPLGAYVGSYTNRGYHEMLVTVKDGELFIDATDRTSGGFVVRFEHVGQQTKFIARFTLVLEGNDDCIAAEFKLQGGQAVSLGLHLEAELDELIWFDRVN